MTANIVRFWNNIKTQTAEIAEPYVFEDDEADSQPDHDMERLAKGVELATSNVVHCEAELIKAQMLRNRCIERFNAERVRRGIPHE